MQRPKDNPYEGSFYKTHRLYQFLGIVKMSSKDDIQIKLDNEIDVRTTMMQRHIQQNKDVAARINNIMNQLGNEKKNMLEMVERQKGDSDDIRILFKQARTIFLNKTLKANYDTDGDPPDLPQLPPAHQQYYSLPDGLPPDYLVRRPQVPDLPPPPKEPHPDYLVQRRRRRTPLQERSEDTILAQPSK